MKTKDFECQPGALRLNFSIDREEPLTLDGLSLQSHGALRPLTKTGTCTYISPAQHGAKQDSGNQRTICI